MKRILFFICLTLISNQGLFAQLEYLLPENLPQSNAELFEVQPKKNNYRGEIVRGWYDYGFKYVNDNGITNALYLDDFLFPDSAYFEYSDTIVRGSNYKIASIIDPKAALFNNIDSDFGPYLPYYVDSVVVFFQYYRHSTPDIVDTLFVEIGSDSSLTTASLTGPYIQSVYGIKALPFKALKFKTDGKVIGDLDIPRKQKIPILLNPSDTLVNGKILPVALPRFRGGENVVVSLSFKPGFQYSASDTITKKGNLLRVYTWDLQGDNGDPQYFSGEWNCSYSANYNNLKSADPQWYSWYATFLPLWIWPTAYWVNIKTSYDYDWIGVSESNMNISKNKCFPNPSANDIIIAYDLKSQDNVTINIYDVTGQLILQKTEGNQFKGQHFSKISLNDLSSGIYFYSLNNGEMNKFIKE